jgi:hypothetical protein
MSSEESTRTSQEEGKPETRSQKPEEKAKSEAESQKLEEKSKTKPPARRPMDAVFDLSSGFWLSSSCFAFSSGF